MKKIELKHVNFKYNFKTLTAKETGLWLVNQISKICLKDKCTDD